MAVQLPRVAVPQLPPGLHPGGILPRESREQSNDTGDKTKRSAQVFADVSTAATAKPRI